MTARVAEILIPLALDTTYTYAVPDGMELAAGAVVAAPLGPTTRVGVVWSVRPGAGANYKAIEAGLPVPPLAEPLRRFIDWLAWYTLAPKGSALAMALRLPGDAPEQADANAISMPPGSTLYHRCDNLSALPR